MGIEFKCSNGWLKHFEERWNITWQAMSGDGATADIDLTQKWCESMALFHNVQPKEDTSFKGRKVPRRERI
jgi:hypothetical protein